MSLMELLVVVGILAVLAGSAIGYFSEARSQAENAVVSENLRLYREAMSRYFKTNMAYPTDVGSFTLENFSGKTANSMFLLPFQNASVTLFVEVPDTAAGASSNAWQATKTVIIPWFPGVGGPGVQFRNLKIKIDQTIMSW